MVRKRNEQSRQDALSDFVKSPSMDRSLAMKVLEDALRSIIKHKFGSDLNFETVINVDTGDIQVWRYRDIVPDSEYNLSMHDKISLSDAKKIESDFQIGEQVAEEVNLDIFGRRSIFNAKHMMSNAISNVKMDALVRKYSTKIGEIVSFEVFHAYGKKVILIDEDGDTITMAPNSRIPGEKFRKGDHIRAVVDGVSEDPNNLGVMVSRTSSKFLAALLEIEIPEIKEGIIDIRQVVREPGERAKVVVQTYNDNIDPVGSCVGVKGVRINAITRELNNENIDIINYTESPDLFISRIFSPAKISSIKYLQNNRLAIYLRPDQVAKAIGIKGHNISLASRLLGMEIDLYRELNNEHNEIRKEDNWTDDENE